MTVRTRVPLAAHTTLAVGGAAAFWCEARSPDEVGEALALADERSLPLIVLGGGSNVLFADRDLDAVVLRVRIEGIDAIERAGTAHLSVGAGTSWDDLVAWTVERGYAGIECLSGIPGEVGAAPMQNIGAYGQEVAGAIMRVRMIDRRDGRTIEMTREQCRFGYRDSIFKHEAAERYVVLAVELELHAGPPTIAYAELERALADESSPRLADVRRTVIALRRGKSMVLDPDDPNRRTAGSFFVNPTVSAAHADEVAARATRIAPGERMPRFDHGEGAKLSAAWLIERSGLPKGTRHGNVGLSSRHCLAIVNHGDANASEIVSFAAHVRERVRDTFGVTLTPEPRCYGFEQRELASLLE
jgi:UDP-N-acetylmuramate dehydrogenase